MLEEVMQSITVNQSVSQGVTKVGIELLGQLEIYLSQQCGLLARG